MAVLSAAGRRRWPAAVLVVSTIASAILISITVNPLPALAPAFCMYLIPLRFRHRDALWLLAGTLLVTAAGCAAFGAMSHGVSGRGGADQAEAVMLESSLAIIGAWLVGYSVGQRRAAAASRPNSWHGSNSPRPGGPAARSGCASPGSCMMWSRTR